LGLVRFYWKTDPYGGNKGVDDFSLVYMAEGEGEISIDKTHKEYKIIEKEEYEKIKETLHPFIREFMDLVIKKI
ncbi:hypothetical protein HYT24_01040, partial [Candidatus Pacearchaeota archaeon]|nr:hypothetical protein [Candidatus Pacearchaeota archaeon]